MQWHPPPRGPYWAGSTPSSTPPALTRYDLLSPPITDSQSSFVSTGPYEWDTSTIGPAQPIAEIFPYILPHGEYGYRPDFNAPNMGAINTLPRGWRIPGEYVPPPGMSATSFEPYDGRARNVQFTSMADQRPPRRGWWRRLLYSCFGVVL